MAGTTGFEPATSDVTGRRSNQLNYVPALPDRRSQNSTGLRVGASFGAYCARFSAMLRADVVPASAPADVRFRATPPHSPRMKASVQISRGIESLFGTRDENIRLIESSLNVRTRLLNDSLEIEGEETSVARAAQILNDYVALMREGHTFNNGDLNSYLRVVTADADTSLRGLVESGKQRTFGKKVITPKSMTQRRYIDALKRYDLVFGIGPAGTGKTYLAVAMAVSALLSKRVSRIILTPVSST